jgi:multiple sugar transport system permease protein
MRARPIHFAMVAPVQLLLLVTIGVPSIAVLWLSFMQTGLGHPTIWVGLRNYMTVLSDPQFRVALVNSFILVNAVVYIELALALGIACLFAAGVPLRKLLIALMLAPYAISEVVAVTTWKYAMDPTIGLFAHWLDLLALPPLDWAGSPVAGLVLIGVISIWLHLPFSSILLYSARLGLDTSVYEAASIDGAGPLRQFCAITLPLLLPTILVAILFRLVFALRMFSEVWLLNEGGPARLTETLAVYLYKEAFRYDDVGAGSATGWLLVVGSVMLAWFYLRRIQLQMADG